jgi:hypothetical protein
MGDSEINQVPAHEPSTGRTVSMTGFRHEDHDSMQRFIRRENVIHFGRLLAIETVEAKRQMLMKLLAEERKKQREAGDLAPRSESLSGTASRNPPVD